MGKKTKQNKKHKKYFFFFCLYSLLWLLLLVCGDVESNPGPGAGRGARVLYANIRGLHANLTELGVVGSLSLM